MNRLQTGLLAIAMILFGEQAAKSEVVLTPLDAGAIAADPALQQLDLGAGDVLLRNDVFQVAILATPRRGQPERVGRCIFTTGAGDGQYVFQCGPVGNWKQGEAGGGGGLAVVRFERKSDDWSAELTFQLADGRPWLDVTTVVRNLSKRTLEFPLVNALQTPDAAQLSKLETRGALVLTTANASGFAIIPGNGKLHASTPKGGEWFIGHVSTDSQPGLLPRVGKRLIRFGRSDSFSPIDADSSWDAAMKDRRHWYRLAPGQTRTFTLRLTETVGGDAQIQPLLQLAAQTTAPAVQLVRSKAPPARPTAAAVRNSRPVVSPSPPTPTTVTAKPPMVVSVSPTMPEPSTPVPPAAIAKSLSEPAPLVVIPSDDGPKVMPDALKEIEKLPPPIK